MRSIGSNEMKFELQITQMMRLTFIKKKLVQKYADRWRCNIHKHI